MEYQLYYDLKKLYNFFYLNLDTKNKFIKF